MPEITDEKMAELVAKFKEFIRERYYKELVKASNENTALVVDFNEMEKFNPEFCAWLAEDPETMFKVSAEAVRQIDMGPQAEPEEVSEGEEKEPEYVAVRFAGLPEIINIRDIRAKQLGRFIATEGIVRRASEIRPEIMETEWECMECGSIVSQEIKGSFVMKPFQCSCGGRSFKQAGKKMIDARWITIEEPFELTEGEQPSQLTIFLARDLVAKDKRSMTDPGNRLRICGVLRDIPKGKFNSAKLDFFLDANSLEPTEIGWEKVEVSKEDEEEIKKLAMDPDIYENFVGSLAPSIYGYPEIKESIILQMFSGVPRVFKDKMKLRGEIHILMIGDPASGKSQLLKIVPNMIPRGRYVSGKGVTSAGLTATVTKDEQFMGGWVLEAGAMVLSNKGMLAIDEFEKMDESDQVAMHEALEQGCYDYSTEVILGDGTAMPIGQLVEGFTEGCRNDPAIKCIKEKGIELMSVDLGNNTIKPSKASFVSKHTENRIYGIKIFTGQELKITASHPVFTIRDGALALCRASELREGDWIPLPSSINIEGKNQKLAIPTGLKGRKKIRLPENTSPEFCEWLGFIAGEGCAEVNRGRRRGVCFTNSDPEILSRYKKITSSLFAVKSYSQTKAGRTMLRLISKDLYDFAISNADGILNKSYGKKLPPWVFKITKEECASLLRGLFDSEGSINYKYGTVTFSTTSPELAKQVQHLCLRLGIFAGMYNDASMKGGRMRPAYKIQISGKKNISAFSEHVGFRGKRAKKLFALLRKKTVPSRQDHLPNIMQSLEHVKKALHLSDYACAGYVMYGNRKRDFITKSLASKVIKRFDSRIKEVEASLCALEKEMPYSTLLHERKALHISRSEIARRLGISEQNLWYREAVKKDENWIERSKNETLKIAKEMLSVRQEAERLRHLLEAPLEWVRIKKIETKEGKVWVYDVQMNPIHTFIGNGILCHNSVSIAKASIVATLPAQTSVLAGGNPKFSRFDTYRSITEQINIPDTLLSRFDLKFALRDVPNAETDKLIVDHVLKAREGDESGIAPVIDPMMVRKYISYAKKNCKPKLTKETGKLLKDYYIKTRKKAEGGNAPIPITLRQFESLIRLAEASAKIQLSDVVRREDAQRAIRLMEFSLMQLGYDVATGRIDVDKSEGATSFTERSRIRLLIEIINNLSVTKKEIALKELYEAARKEGMPEQDLDGLVEKLKREGMLFEPNPGFVQKV